MPWSGSPLGTCEQCKIKNIFQVESAVLRHTRPWNMWFNWLERHFFPLGCNCWNPQNKLGSAWIYIFIISFILLSSLSNYPHQKVVLPLKTGRQPGSVPEETREVVSDYLVKLAWQYSWGWSTLESAYLSHVPRTSMFEGSSKFM